MPRRLDRVLVATDFSPGADLALRRTLRLPLAPRARVVVLHVLRQGSPKAQAEAEPRARAALAALASETAVPDGIELVTALAVGEPFEQIITHARGLGAGLIVIGRHGHGRLRQMLLGTTAERTIRYGDTPVLVVNVDVAGPYRRPLVATGLDDDARRIADLAVGVVEPGIELALVHAYRVAFEDLQPAPRHGPLEHELEMEARGAMEKLLATLETERVRWRPVIRRGDARTVISSEVVAANADLVILGTHGRAGLARVLVGSIAEWVISTALCDVLVGRPTRFTFELP